VSGVTSDDARAGARPLAGQKALVTGATSGIGRAIAVAMGRAGADVAVNWHEGDAEVEAVVEQIRASGVEVLPFRADVSDERAVRGMFSRVIDAMGTVDILVNNAGIQRGAPLTEMTLDQWNAVLAVNLTGQFLCAREAVREFRRRGVVESVSRAAGKLLCISSVHAAIPWAGHVNYAASKGGVQLLMESIAQQVARDRIRVNGIAPGAIRTPINRDAWAPPEARDDLLELIPYGRIGEPDDIGRVAAWLASDEADYIHGTTLVVDGGMMLYPGFRGRG